MLLLVTWRGFEGRDAPEHLVMGGVLPGVLDLFEHPAPRSGCVDALLADVDWAAATLRATAQAGGARREAGPLRRAPLT